VVEEFKDESFEIELYTPDIHCNTALVYKTFRQKLFDAPKGISSGQIEPTSFEGWETLSSKEVLSKVDAVMANDLYKASLIAYPKLLEAQPKEWYFSGSGSTFFRIK